MSRIPIAVIKAALQSRVLQLVKELLPSGDHGFRHRAPAAWFPTNPRRNDRAPGSFKVWLTGPAAGAWKDYASGEKGDIIDLVMLVKGGERADAIAWAKDWLGLQTVDPKTLERMRRDAEARKREEAKRALEGDARKMRRAFELWLAASPVLAGTPVETYLAARGIPLAAIPHIEAGELRYAKALEWWKGARRDSRGAKVASGPVFPALVCAIRNHLGEVTGVHCTFLAPDGRGKAPVDAPKLMYGLVAGGVIRLSRGPSNLTPEEAAAQRVAGLLCVGEGVEDGLTLAIGVPEARAWAATSLGNLGNVPLDHSCVEAALVARDNDWGNGQAAKGFAAAMDRLLAHGKPVVPMSSHHGKDFNDIVRRDDDE